MPSPRALIGLVLVLAACKPRAASPGLAKVVHPDAGVVAAGELIPAGSLLGDHVWFQFALYQLDVAPDPRAALARLARQSGFMLISPPAGKPPKEPTVWWRKKAIEDYRPPAPEAMESPAVELSAAQKKALGRARAVTVVDFSGPAEDARTLYRAALELMVGLQAALGGLPWDEMTRQIFTPESWAKRLDNWSDGLPSVIPHITIHSYRHGDLLRMVTLGMSKFALPDVVVNRVGSSTAQPMSILVTLVCQSLLERPSLDQAGILSVSLDASKHPGFRAWATTDIYPNAKRRVVVRLAPGKPEKGDPDNELVELVFPGGAADLQVRHQELLGALLGTKDKLVHFAHDGAIEEASRRARKTLFGYKARFMGGIPVGETLQVKGPFRTDRGGKEWMWIEVVRWDGKTIKGILQNDPFEIASLKAGARVEIDEGDVFDYMLRKHDGSEEGNETGRLIERQ